MLLTGDDPWIHLPIAADTLQQAGEALQEKANEIKEAAGEQAEKTEQQ